ncbi:MAG: glucose 1-dehydrogenase [Sciscionella sp.]
MGRLQNKVALITGASEGQGAAAARRYVAEGARVMIADIADDEGKSLADELGDATRYQHLDVSNEQHWADAVGAAIAEFDQIDILVNNAGILHFSAIMDTKLADYERVIRINQIGTFLGMRAVIPVMPEGGGSIVNVSSVEGLAGMPFLVAYTASKFAIRGMTKVAAMELGGKGIRVNSVHPGAIDTRMVQTAAGGAEVDLSPIGQTVALRRIGRPEEIADLVVFLGSDESSYCTGAEFVADGGATATHSLMTVMP